MSLGSLYVIAAACVGYVFCQCCHVHRYRIARKSGWYAYLHVTSFGAAFFFIGVLIGRGLLAPMCAATAACPVSVGNELVVFLFDLVASITVATLVCIAINFRLDKIEALQRAWKDDLSLLLYKSIEADGTVTVHLDSGKVFQGYVLDTLEPSEENSHITLLPIWAGYEDKPKLIARRAEDLNQQALNDYVFGDQPLDRSRLTAVTISRDKIVFCQSD